jgi:hypothetical protein
MTPSGRATTLSLDAVVAVIFVGISLSLAIFGFWRMGNSARDAVSLTEYTTVVAAGQEKSFGYGGEMQDQQASVEFQGREMSDICFLMKRDASQGLFVTGKDDSLQIGRRLIVPGLSVGITEGTRFTTRGVLGRASFYVSRSPATDSVSLKLAAPVYWDVGPRPMRILIGPVQEPVASPIDEIHIRASAVDIGTPTRYQIQPAPCGLQFTPELDYGSPAGETALRPTCLVSGRPLTIGPVTLQYHPYSAPVATIFGYGFNRVHFYGVKLAIALLLGVLLFSLPVQITWPYAKSLYGAISLMVVIGTILSARDYLFEPHADRFLSYTAAIPILAGVLFALRIPFFETGVVLAPLWQWRTVGLACLGFGFISTMLHDQFTGSSISPLPDRHFVVGCLLFLLACAFAAALLFALRRVFDHWKGMVWTEAHFRALLVLGSLPLLLIAANRLLLGGSEAIHLPGFRVHLVTLLVPFLAFFVSWLLWVANSDTTNLPRRVFWTSLFGFVITAGYWISSRDNGGMALLLLAFAAAISLGLRSRLYPLAFLLVFGTGGYFIARTSNSPRFELAWGTQEQQVLHYDPAINLRLGRDLARAGGPFGLGDQFFVPSGLRSNLHNDLIATYIAGYLGLVVLAITMLAYALFYVRLLGGLAWSLDGLDQQNKSNPSQDARRILIATAAAIGVTYGFQALWVVAAALQQSVPLTGLDLQPISASNISLVNFFAVLCASVAISHNVCKT